MVVVEKSSYAMVSVKLDQLFLWPENPRHEELDGERDAIAELCSSEDIDALARDIARFGTNPAERLILVPRDVDEPLTDKSVYVVAEGNRRVCAMKLLRDPALAPSRIRPSIEASSKIWIAPNTIDCVVITDPDLRKHWLERMHGGVQGGIGRKPWSSEQKTRFLGSGRNTIAQALLDYAETKSMITKSERDGRLSHLSRLMSNALIKDALGLDVSRGPDDLMRNRTSEEFDLVLRCLIDEAGTKSLGSQVKKPAIDGFARQLQQLPGVSPHRIDLEPIVELVGGDDEPRDKPKPPKNETYIRHHSEIAERMAELKATKLQGLYYSICKLNLKHHTPLITIGIWALLESLSSLAGRNDKTAYPDYFSKQKMTDLGLGTGKELNALELAIKRTSEHGNVTKHHKTSATYDSKQLANDMETLRPLLVAVLNTLRA